MLLDDILYIIYIDDVFYIFILFIALCDKLNKEAEQNLNIGNTQTC